MITDTKQREHDQLDAQLELLKKSLHNYLTVQQKSYYDHRDMTQEQLDHSIAALEGYQQMLEIYWQHVLIAADHKLGSEVRKRKRTANR